MNAAGADNTAGGFLVYESVIADRIEPVKIKLIRIRAVEILAIINFVAQSQRLSDFLE